MTGGNGNDPTAPVEAVRALRARGVDQAEDMLQHGTPEQILAACHRWDARKGVGPGLLVRWIRAGEFEDPPSAPPISKAQQQRDRFEQYTRRFPIGIVVEPHATLIARRWPGDLEYGDACAGDMVVIEALFPLLSMECDRCGFVAAVGVRDLHLFGPPLTLVEPEADW